MNRIPVFFLLFLIGYASCNQQNKKDNSVPAATTDTVSTLISAVKPVLTIEEAETVIAKVYSDQNKKAGYPLFRGLFLHIDTISYNPDTSSAIINAIVSGRKRKSESDTSTTPFDNKEKIKVDLKDGRWVAEY
jgi:uncharacterized protein YlzI (FlbEa/FlbD family)